jgi:hypothetical protein
MSSGEVLMFSGSRLEWLVFVGMCICVLALTLFPAPTRHAPFNAVYGPTTDLRSSIDVHQAFPLMLTCAPVEHVGARLLPAQLEPAQHDPSATISGTGSPRTIVLRC